MSKNTVFDIIICLTAITLFVSVFCAVQFVKAETNDWIIVPGKRAGVINSKTTRPDLIRLFGGNNVRAAEIQMGEGFMETGTVVFPDNPERKISILWKGPDPASGPAAVRLSGTKSLWKTDKGITLGTTLKELEVLNGKPFTLSGFGWDYEGTVIASGGGKLSELGMEDSAGFKGRILILRLSPSREASEKSPYYSSVVGDRDFSSDNEAMQKLNPGVYQMSSSFEDKDE